MVHLTMSMSLTPNGAAKIYSILCSKLNVNIISFHRINMVAQLRQSKSISVGSEPFSSDFFCIFLQDFTQSVHS